MSHTTRLVDHVFKFPMIKYMPTNIQALCVSVMAAD